MWNSPTILSPSGIRTQNRVADATTRPSVTSDHFWPNKIVIIIYSNTRNRLKEQPRWHLSNRFNSDEIFLLTRGELTGEDDKNDCRQLQRRRRRRRHGDHRRRRLPEEALLGTVHRRSCRALEGADEVRGVGERPDDPVLARRVRVGQHLVEQGAVRVAATPDLEEGNQGSFSS